MEFKQTFDLIVSWKLFQKTKVLSDNMEVTLWERLKDYEVKNSEQKWNRFFTSLKNQFSEGEMSLIKCYQIGLYCIT